MSDQQQSTADDTMADHKEKPVQTAMADQQQPPGKMEAVRYSTEQVGEAVALLKEITARLEGTPGVRDEVLGLLVGLGDSHGDTRAAASRAAALLRGHPGVVDRFNAFLAGAPPPPPESLAVTRPRRSTTATRRRLPSSVPAEERPDVSLVSATAGAGDHNRRALDDPRHVEAIAFEKKVEEIAGEEALNELVELLDDVSKDEEMDAGEIYRRAMGVLGPAAHAGGDLLHEFATGFLPGMKEWEAQQQQEEARRRQAAAAKKRTATKRRAAGDDRRQHALHAGGSSGGGAHQFDANAVTPEIVKKRRADNGDHRRHDDIDSHTPKVRIKKPRADDAVFSGSHAAPPRGLPEGDTDKKPPRRRAANGGEGCSSAAAALPPPPAPEENDPNAMFRRFRELWVFYTHYSTMAEIIARAKELLAMDPDELPLTVEEQFPRRRHREFLETYYAGHWGKMKAKLEGGGTTTAAALDAVLESLRRKEEETVAEEVSQRRMQDAARAIERLHGLVTDIVRKEEERQRPDASDGGASGAERHMGPRR
ncbi:hypothetical protein HU200_052860 [Digitaria exilis]|uniref:Uncharacterized protein n=1 Tax=Digitaria exilis TaxID=1010633 RepID=A0A835ASX7_9POAL|nr:hypothetical protein HU200_052860 [Digitaria exilis]